MTSSASASRRRRRRLRAVAAVHLVLAVAVSFVALSLLDVPFEPARSGASLDPIRSGVPVGSGRSGLAFLLGTSLALVAAAAIGRRSLVVARSEAGPQPATAATLVTAIRAGTLVPLAGVLAVSLVADPTVGSNGWLPATLYGTVAALDVIDGALARATDSVTALGARLDTEADALGILLASALAVRYGAAPAAFIAVGAARYLFVAGMHFRSRRGLALHELDDRPIRRVLAGAAMLAVWIALLPAVAPEHAGVVTAFVAVPFLGHFLRDWLVVSGRLG